MPGRVVVQLAEDEQGVGPLDRPVLAFGQLGVGAGGVDVAVYQRPGP